MVWECDEGDEVKIGATVLLLSMGTAEEVEMVYIAFDELKGGVGSIGRGVVDDKDDDEEEE